MLWQKVGLRFEKSVWRTHLSWREESAGPGSRDIPARPSESLLPKVRLRFDKSMWHTTHLSWREEYAMIVGSKWQRDKAAGILWVQCGSRNLNLA
jgi:hypothetical protein